MYYLIQSNIYSDPEHHKIFEVLEELGLEYETIELTSAAEHITTKADRNDVFVYGSVKLARLARANTHWNPGSFYGGKHTFEMHAPAYGKHMLNYEAAVFKFGEPHTWLPGQSLFIKPYKDAKVFSGKVFRETTWNDFVYESLQNPRTPMLHAETLVQASVPQQLIKEARIWIVGGKAIAGVYYKYHGDVPFEKEVSREALDFAQQMVGVFNVADAFVMDVGLTYDGWKIVEINCVNSAGFYNLNIKTLFRALEAFF